MPFQVVIDATHQACSQAGGVAGALVSFSPTPNQQQGMYFCPLIARPVS
jgi:hypothetical protein